MNTHDYIESLIAKVLAGEASPSEIKEVEAWKSSDIANQEYFEILKKIFDEAPLAKKSEYYNTDKAWSSLSETIHGESSHKTKVIQMSPTASAWWWKVAAMIVVVIGMGWLVAGLFNREPSSYVAFNSGFATLDTLLPDSTVIFMNRNANVTYQNTDSKRSVQLKGEAYFKIAPNAELPFVLTAGTLEITDIGTSFHVNAPMNADSVVVYVESGEVQLKTTSGKSINLLKGEEGVYFGQNDMLMKSAKADTNLISYKTKIFVFENAALENVVRKLNDVYGSSITISDAIENCHLTATFRNEKIDSIVAIIAETLGLEIKKDGDLIFLDGKSCDQ